MTADRRKKMGGGQDPDRVFLNVTSSEQMEHLGALLAPGLLASGGMVELVGDLGAGKTTLVRGMLKALGHRGVVRSPTYTLMEEYPIGGRPLLHMDLYRLADAGELEYLGLRDALRENPLLLVEWPERGRGELPPSDLLIRIAYAGEGREMELQALSDVGRCATAAARLYQAG